MAVFHMPLLQVRTYACWLRLKILYSAAQNRHLIKRDGFKLKLIHTFAWLWNV